MLGRLERSSSEPQAWRLESPVVYAIWISVNCWSFARAAGGSPLKGFEAWLTLPQPGAQRNALAIIAGVVPVRSRHQSAWVASVPAADSRSWGAEASSAGASESMSILVPAAGPGAATLAVWFTTRAAVIRRRGGLRPRPPMPSCASAPCRAQRRNDAGPPRRSCTRLSCADAELSLLFLRRRGAAMRQVLRATVEPVGGRRSP